MSDFDVIVVGGGPGGATAAALCTQRGLRVALFEHTHFPRQKVCGDVINPNCWPVLEKIGAAESVRALPHHEIAAASFAAPTGGVLTVPMPRGATAIRRSLFDHALLEHARICGVEVFEDQTVREITLDRRVITSLGSFQARSAIIGADGRHSVTARSAGLMRKLPGGNEHIAFQAHFRAPAALDGRVQLHLFHGGYCGVVRVDGERANLCIVTDRRGARFHNDCEALFAHTVRQNPHFRNLGIDPEPLEPLHSTHPLRRPMNVPARNGVFLVGDALRVMEPFTGQGILFALRTAEIAARSIASPSQPEKNYIAEVTALYRHRGRTNEWLRRVMYRERAARAVIPLVRRLPVLARWLADNVLGEERRFR
jgi:flavin-dependent dehydrogenase